jgi:lysophospholipase L1-like esterase
VILAPPAMCSGARPSAAIDDRICGGSLTLDQWHHVAGTYDGATFILYLDGVPVASAARSGSIAVNANDLLIGNFSSLARPFDGGIDEVRIWNVARTAGQIMDNMNVELTGAESGLVAYYSFNEGGGQIAADSTVNGNDGILGTTAGADANDPAWASILNSAPFVDAGPNRTITLPSNQVALDGTVTDDGLPLSGILTTTWSKISGSGTVTFDNASEVDTTATFSSADTYILRLTADDGASSNLDELMVVVRPAPDLDAIVVNPGSLTLNSFDTRQFEAQGFDQYNQPFTFTPAWSSTFGSISGSGLFSPDSNVGKAFVTAADGSVNEEVEILVVDSSHTNTLDFFDGFILDSTLSYEVTNTLGSGGTFTHDAGGEQANVVTGSGVGLQVSRSIPYLTHGTFSVDFTPTVTHSGDSFFSLRLVEDSNNYFEISNTITGGTGTNQIVKVVDGSTVYSSTFSSGYALSSTYPISVHFTPASTTVDAFGEVIVINPNADTIVVNRFELELSQQDASIDTINYITDPLLTVFPLTTVDNGGDSDTAVTVDALSENLQAGWVVRFILDGGAPRDTTVTNPAADTYQVNFTGVSTWAEHTLQYQVLDSGTPIASQVSQGTIVFYTGDYYVAEGDSITRGSQDVTEETSADGRNTSFGYTPVLNDLLTAAKGYAHNVENEGDSGDFSSDGVIDIPTTLTSHPNARYYLIQFGTNDAKALVPTPSGLGMAAGDPGYAGSFKDNMQQIIDAVIADGKVPYVAKIPPLFGSFSFANPLLQEYNLAIEELVIENAINVVPPDFYTYFENNPGQIADDIHPNDTGYDAMADLWKDGISVAAP